jgi:hypothetical protein
MALLFVGPRSIGDAVSCVRISDAIIANGRGILESVQADVLSPTTGMLSTATAWEVAGRIVANAHHRSPALTPWANL